MASWGEVVTSAPDFAVRARALLDAHKHKTIATLRKDGSPRISGIEASFVGNELTFGSMPGAQKARDLQRDPRFALHSASIIAPDGDPGSFPGDAKLSGMAAEVTDPDELKAIFTEQDFDPAQFAGSHFFRADIREVVITAVVDGKFLRIELWRPGQELSVVDRT